ncbi:hypothetical protein F4808DRAFT_158140 [Astrocystis sublimbata]|nr:hypothetical protein F4808DRAFT_158140 [Astrocystis sublimbata]
MWTWTWIYCGDSKECLFLACAELVLGEPGFDWAARLNEPQIKPLFYNVLTGVTGRAALDAISTSLLKKQPNPERIMKLAYLSMQLSVSISKP